MENIARKELRTAKKGKKLPAISRINVAYVVAVFTICDIRKHTGREEISYALFIYDNRSIARAWMLGERQGGVNHREHSQYDTGNGGKKRAEVDGTRLTSTGPVM